MAGFADANNYLTVPPGSHNSFYVASGPPVTTPITVNPVTQRPLDVPIKPVSSPTPTPVTTQEVVPVVIVVEEIPINTYSVHCKEGIRVQGGDLLAYSTGLVYPTQIENGAAGDGAWSNPGNASFQDGNVATCVTAGSGYTGQLKASGFAPVIPAGAVIVGVKVHVLRSKI